MVANQPEINGTVFSSDGYPLTYAVILKHPGELWVLTDEEGHFRINATTGDSLSIIRYGYKSIVISLTDDRNLHLVLAPLPVTLDSITVTAKPTRIKSRQTFDTVIPAATNLNVRRIPTSLYRNYGGPGGILTVSLDGGLSRHTKILLDGIDLSSPQNGETDLSQVPAFLIDRLTLSRTPILSDGSGAIDGSIIVRSSSNSNKFTFIRGSYGFQSLAGRIQLRKGSWITTVSHGTTTADGNYPVKYLGTSTVRHNNNFNQIFWSSKVKGLVGTYQFLSLQVLKSDQRRGVPGTIQSPNPDSKRIDNLELIQIKTGWILKKSVVTTSFIQRNSSEHYSDPRSAIDSRHKLSVQHLRARWNLQMGSTLQIIHFLEMKQETITSTDAGEHRRINTGVTSRFLFRPDSRLQVMAGLRLDRDPAHYQELSWQSQLAWQLSEQLNINVNGGQGFKYPSFNDLYWKPGGNPALKPEYTYFQTLVLNYLPDENRNWELRISRKESRDLIQWIPISTIWKPVNVSRSLRHTVTLKTRGSQLDGRASYEGYLSYFQTKDRSNQKRLLYVPSITGNLLLSLKMGKTVLKTQLSYVGKQVSAYDWPRDVSLPPYQLVSIGFEFQPFGRGKHLKASLWIENLFDEQYQTINGYPEPGRQGRLSLTYESS